MVILGLFVGLTGCGTASAPSNSTNTSTSSTDTNSTTPSTDTTGSMTAKADLDATNCNPGESINPIDAGKTFSSTNFKYTLLDVRKDKLVVDPAIMSSMKYDEVLLVKLQVENISKNNDLNLSVAEVDLTRNAAPTDGRIKDDKYMTDFMYPRKNMCVDLGGDVDTGTFPAGKKVVGYYVYGLPKDKSYEGGLYFGGRYYAAEDVEAGKSLKVAGTFKLQ